MVPWCGAKSLEPTAQGDSDQTAPTSLLSQVGGRGFSRAVNPIAVHVMRLLQIACMAFLLSGCAEYFGGRARIASMNLQLPGATPTDIARDSSRASQLAGEVAQRHGLSSVPSSHPFAGRTLYVGPGYSGGPWPGQPDVDWDGGSHWKLTIDRPHDLPDTIKCAYFPPRSGNVAAIVLLVNFASRIPPAAGPLWQDLKSTLATQFGRGAIIKQEDLR